MSTFRKRNEDINTLEEYVFSKSGKHIAELNTYKDHYYINGLKEAADKIKEAVKTKRQIYVFADYDADGIDSAAILFLMFEKLRKKYGIEKRTFRIVVPDRSWGYGVNETKVAAMEDNSLLITVDNGITAIKALKKAKEKNMEIIIMDHHKRKLDGTLPPYDILIDPSAFPDSADFSDYCGAGLSYKLCEEMFPNDKEFLLKISAFAAIGTVGDCVSMTEDNRRIVRAGMYALNKDKSSQGLSDILSLSNISGHVFSEDIGFRIAPVINASSRMRKFGAAEAMRAIISEKNAPELAGELIRVNNERKEATAEMLSQVTIDYNDPINFHVVKGNPSICGLVAAKLAESTGKPSFVMAESAPGLLSGSARSDDETVNDIISVLDYAKEYLHTYGGHKGAAGFSVKTEDVEKLHKELSSAKVVPHEENILYDLDIEPKAEDFVRTAKTLAGMEPFGKNFEKPVYRVKVSLNNSASVKMFGDNHVRVTFDDSRVNAVGFFMGDKLSNELSGDNAYLYGTISFNINNGKAAPQMMLISAERI